MSNIIKDTSSVTGSEISGQEAAEGLYQEVKITIQEVIEHCSHFIEDEVDLIKS